MQLQETAPAECRWRPCARINVGRFLKARREALGLSQEEIAALSTRTPWRLTRAGISSIERGNNFPGLEALLVYRFALDVRPAELLEIATIASSDAPDDRRPPGDSSLAAAHHAISARRFDDAQAIYRRILQAGVESAVPAPASPARRRAYLLLRLSSALAGCRSPLAAEEAARAAVDQAQGVPEIRADASIRLAELQLARGAIGAALESSTGAIDLAGNLSPPVRAAALLVHGKALLRAGSAEKARGSLLSARKIYRDHRDRAGKIEATGRIGLCLIAMNRRREARRWLQAAVRSARRHRLVDAEGCWNIELGRLSLEAGQTEEARSIATAVMRSGKSHGKPLLSFRAAWLRIRISRGDPRGEDNRKILALLCRLYPHLERREDIRELAEFRDEILPGLLSETP